ncbi:tryptophan-rich sensory protein [Lacicoccus qingdaonensis]|uniref:TspO and MBR related proteins n=1 Tax=Lacicoccus qingdaonensis TaxID=576118 RepID=A0A1G9FE73_9BACL|nr:tryptophan-rich sensory protein [Salinicoccus qingdaonensis]SDK86725.1 TspO and MBR related proteins [Salinicoccus qingdaonensis]
MTRQRKWVIGYFTAFIIMIIMNYSVGSDVGNVADENPTIIQPAGFAFAIWGLIYVLIFIWMIKLFFSKNEQPSITERLKYWPIINFILNGIWIVVFTQQWMIISTIVILLLLFTLIKIHIVISAELYHWYDRLPFSIYFGWVTIASIVNIFTAFSNYNIDSFLGTDELIWTIIAIIAAALIGLFIAWFLSDWLYPLVLLWPFFGIFMESGDVSTGLNVSLATASLILVITATVIIIRKIKAVSV